MNQMPITENTSDGFHTFAELYRFRLLYNAALFNAWDQLAGEGIGPECDVHKSLRHSDGELPFPNKDGTSDWFIVVAQLGEGYGQISNHYRIEEAWDLFRIPVREKAAPYDGHTAADVADRLARFVQSGTV